MIDQVLAFAMFTPSRSLARPLALLLSFSVTVTVTFFLNHLKVSCTYNDTLPLNFSACASQEQACSPSYTQCRHHTHDVYQGYSDDGTHWRDIQSNTGFSTLPSHTPPSPPIQDPMQAPPLALALSPLAPPHLFLVFCDLSVLKRPSQLSWMVPCNLDLSLHPPARVQGKHFWQEECRHDAAACFPRPHLGGRALWVCPTVRVAVDRLPEICPSPCNSEVILETQEVVSCSAATFHTGLAFTGKDPTWTNYCISGCTGDFLTSWPSRKKGFFFPPPPSSPLIFWVSL